MKKRTIRTKNNTTNNTKKKLLQKTTPVKKKFIQDVGVYLLMLLVSYYKPAEWLGQDYQLGVHLERKWNATRRPD